MIETAALTALVFDAFTRKITWLEAAGRYTPDQFIESFRNTRSAMQRLLNDLNDAQVNYIDTSTPIWSLSETITHLIYSQNFYYNQLLEITTTALPHIVEAARGFGEGAQRGVPADELRSQFDAATVLIMEAIEQTRSRADLGNVTKHPVFGPVNYAAWLLLLLAHELDHYRQSVVMRRLAKAAGGMA